MNDMSSLQTALPVFEDIWLHLAEMFYRGNDLIPDNQKLECIPHDTPVAEAFEKMISLNFSQLPVLRGDRVIGVFSYRSFATYVTTIGQSKFDYNKVPVEDLLEPIRYLPLLDDWEKDIDLLKREDALIIGTQDRPLGIVTAVDVMEFLKEVAVPFVIIREIELTLRRIIQVCVDETQWQFTIEDSNARLINQSQSKEHLLPQELDKMSFEHYEKLISINWDMFKQVFGEGELRRPFTITKLQQIGGMRNDICHFKRELTQAERKLLSEHRFWLRERAESFHEQGQIKND